MISTKTKKVLASFGQLNRNQEYRIITKIVKEDSRIHVLKEAYSEKSYFHIANMKRYHEKVSSIYDSIENIRLVKLLDSSEQFLEYEYVKGVSLDQILYVSIMEGDYKKAITDFDRLFTVIDQLSGIRSTHEDSVVKKINDIYSKSGQNAKYMNPGIIDLNPDNFIVEKNGVLVAFDNEWVFEQPVASNYLKTRILHTFFARRSDAFSYLPSTSNIFIKIVDSDIQTFIPKAIYRQYSKLLSKSALRIYWKAEDEFQKYVNHDYQIRHSSHIKNYKIEEIKDCHKTIPEIIENQLEDLQSFNELKKQLIAQQDYRIVLERHINNLESQLETIKSTIPYRALKKAKSIKKKIVK